MTETHGVVTALAGTVEAQGSTRLVRNELGELWQEPSVVVGLSYGGHMTNFYSTCFSSPPLGGLQR